MLAIGVENGWRHSRVKAMFFYDLLLLGSADLRASLLAAGLGKGAVRWRSKDRGRRPVQSDRVGRLDGHDFREGGRRNHGRLFSGDGVSVGAVVCSAFG